MTEPEAGASATVELVIRESRLHECSHIERADPRGEFFPPALLTEIAASSA